MGPQHTKSLLNSKVNNQQNEMAAYGLGKKFANHVSVKGLISKLYKELIQPKVETEPN